LKDDFEPPPAESSPQQLIAVLVGFIARHFEIREETFYGFVKCDVVGRQFIPFKVILKSVGAKRCQLANVYCTPILL